VVEPVEIAQRIGSIHSLFESVQASGLEQRGVICALDVRRDGLMATRLGLEESTPSSIWNGSGSPGPSRRPWTRCGCPSGSPHRCWTSSSPTPPLYTEYARLCGVAMTTGEEHIRAVVPTPAEQRLLGITPDVALFAIERVGCSHGRPVEWRHTLVRGDRFTVTADIAAHDGYRLQQVEGGLLGLANT